MPTNNFLAFATGGSANVESQAAYAADSNRTNGNQPGIASSAFVNKALRQSCWITSQIAQYMVNITGSDVLDDANSANFLATFGSAIKSNVVRSVVSNDTCTNADSVLIMSGASFTETLFTAVGNTGKVLTLLYNGTTFTNVYTLATTGGQTIGGFASTVVKLSTVGEVLTIMSDGTNWQILGHKTSTPWLNTATFTPNNFGTTTNSIWWRRIGDSMETQGGFVAGTPAANPASVTLPVTIDSTKLPSVSTLLNVFANTNGANVVIGSSGVLNDVFYDGSDTAKVYMGYRSNSSPNAFNKDNPNNFCASGTIITCRITFPVSGWQA